MVSNFVVKITELPKSEFESISTEFGEGCFQQLPSNFLLGPWSIKQNVS